MYLIHTTTKMSRWLIDLHLSTLVRVEHNTVRTAIVCGILAQYDRDLVLEAVAASHHSLLESLHLAVEDRHRIADLGITAESAEDILRSVGTHRLFPLHGSWHWMF